MFYRGVYDPDFSSTEESPVVSFTSAETVCTLSTSPLGRPPKSNTKKSYLTNQLNLFEKLRGGGGGVGFRKRYRLERGSGVWVVMGKREIGSSYLLVVGTFDILVSLLTKKK